MDGFVANHFIGWYLKVTTIELSFCFKKRSNLFLFLKTIVLRDSWICLVMSFLFEILEYSLQHQLSNFSECWWDHVIYLVFHFILNKPEIHSLNCLT